MSVGPRIVLTRFASIRAPKLGPWIEHCRRVTGLVPELVEDAPAASDGLDDEQVLIWSLVSANNRALARSARVFARFDAAARDASDCVVGHERLRLHVQSDERAGGYGWRLDLDTEPAVLCARWYSSDRDRRQSFAVALDALGRATVSTGARATHPLLLTGPRGAIHD